MPPSSTTFVRLCHSWRCDATVRRQHKKQDPGPMTSALSTPERELREPPTCPSHMFPILRSLLSGGICRFTSFLLPFLDPFFMFPVVEYRALELEQKDCRPTPHGIRGRFHDMGTAQTYFLPFWLRMGVDWAWFVPTTLLMAFGFPFIIPVWL